MTQNNSILTGSICLSDIPREVMKKVLCKDGQERIYLNIAVIARKEPQTFTDNDKTRTYTHFLTCAPKKEERKDNVNYILGSLETRSFAPATPTVADVEAAPAVKEDDDLPF